MHHVSSFQRQNSLKLGGGSSELWEAMNRKGYQMRLVDTLLDLLGRAPPPQSEPCEHWQQRVWKFLMRTPTSVRLLSRLKRLGQTEVLWS